jgi:hypothetical protein
MLSNADLVWFAGIYCYLLMACFSYAVQRKSLTRRLNPAQNALLSLLWIISLPVALHRRIIRRMLVSPGERSEKRIERKSVASFDVSKYTNGSWKQEKSNDRR